MGTQILDPVKVKEMLNAGDSQADIARYFGVDRSTVTRCCQKNDIVVNTKLVRDDKLAKALIKKDINILNRIERALSQAEEIKGFVDSAINGDKEALKRLDALGTKDKLAGWTKINNDLIANYKNYMEMHKMAHDVQQSKMFRETVMSAIKEELEDQKRAGNTKGIRAIQGIITRLMENKTLREALTE